MRTVTPATPSSRSLGPLGGMFFAAISPLLTGGCATAFVRSENVGPLKHVYPATAFDAEFIWCAGVRGEPLFAPEDPNKKNTPIARMAYGVGGVIDLPFSIVFDTLLLPVDLFRPRKREDTPDVD